MLGQRAEGNCRFPVSVTAFNVIGVFIKHGPNICGLAKQTRLSDNVRAAALTEVRRLCEAVPLPDYTSLRSAAAWQNQLLDWFTEETVFWLHKVDGGESARGRSEYFSKVQRCQWALCNTSGHCLSQCFKRSHSAPFLQPIRSGWRSSLPAPNLH